MKNGVDHDNNEPTLGTTSRLAMTDTWKDFWSMCAALTAASMDAKTMLPRGPNLIFSSQRSPPPTKSIADSSAAAACRFIFAPDLAASSVPIAACAVRTAAASFAGLGAPPPSASGRSSSDADVTEPYPPARPRVFAPLSNARTLASAVSPGRFATRSRALSAGSLSHVTRQRWCDTTCASSLSPIRLNALRLEQHDRADLGVSGADVLV